MKAQAFAAKTAVSVEKSRAELDTLLGKHGAQQRGIMQDDESCVAIVAFTLDGRRYKMQIPLPQPRVTYHDSAPRGWWGWDRNKQDSHLKREHDQACRTRWRAIVMLVRAKLEAVAIGFSTVEREFLSDLLLPNGVTAGQMIGRYIADVVKNGVTAPLALPQGFDK